MPFELNDKILYTDLIGRIFRGRICGVRADTNGRLEYKVCFRMFNAEIVRWVFPDFVSADKIDDSLLITAGRPIVFADGVNDYNLPVNDGSYLVYRCETCRRYYGDILRHFAMYHGMDQNGRQLFSSGVRYTSTPRQRRESLYGDEIRFFQRSSTPVRNRRVRPFY